jgi:3-oxoacyl-[acyl-carrier-protein] synthase-1
MKLAPLSLSHCTASSCIGVGLAATLRSLQQQRSGLTRCEFETARLETYIGAVRGVDEQRLPASMAEFDCRNNRLALLGLQQDGFADAVDRCARRWGRARVGVFLGTSTSGILQTEIAYRRRDPVSGALPTDFNYAGSQNSFSLADFVRRLLRLPGPAAVICTACSSSAKVFAAAQRMIAAGVIDAALVGGVDSLCLTTLYGFHALQLTSPQPCRPFDPGRDGISIGEAAAFALLERLPEGSDAPGVALLGAGESSDAHHMSSPHPQGVGARTAMLRALQAAALAADEIDYINLHGTATASNDSAEAQAVNAVFGAATRCSSTKGATGHTLGAAGALEAVVGVLALQHGFIPAGVNTATIDPALQVNYRRATEHGRISAVLSNSFGFGGANCALIFGRAERRAAA